MDRNIVNSYELDKLKRECEKCVIDLEKSVKSYYDNASEINSVISILKEYYDTTGGDHKIKEIEKIDLLDDSFKGFTNWANSIKINYYKSDPFKEK